LSTWENYRLSDCKTVPGYPPKALYVNYF